MEYILYNRYFYKKKFNIKNNILNFDIQKFKL